MKGFNLKASIKSAKDRFTGALSSGVAAIDSAADSAIEKTSSLGNAAKEKVAGIKTAVVERVENTVDTVKEKTNATLDAVGTAIDSRAHKVSEAAAEFGAAAKRKLGRKEETAVAVPAATETPKAKKPGTKTKKRPAKKHTHR